MLHLKLLLLLMLIELCLAQNCAHGTKQKCKKKGEKIGIEVCCQPKTDACNGTLWTGNKFCENSEEYGCCVPECGEPQPACTNAGGECQSRKDDCDGKWLIGKKYCLNKKKCGCCARIDCPKNTLWPCSALNGTCINHNEVCEGREVTTNGFCKYPDTCKCCLKDEPKQPCDPVECYHWGVPGRCFHDDIPGWSYVGKEQCKGSCECWVSPRPKGPCDPLECQYNGVSGRCSRDGALLEFLGWSNEGAEYCGHGGCNCWLPPQNQCSLDKPLCGGVGCEDGECMSDAGACDEIREDCRGCMITGNQTTTQPMGVCCKKD